MNLLDELTKLQKEVRDTEMQIIELTILSGVSMNGMPSGGTVSSPVERYYDRLEKLRNIVKEKKDRMMAIIQQIDDTEVRVIAELRFLKNETFQNIGDVLFMDRTTAYRKLKDYGGK